MSIESALERLAQAMELHASNSAVAEIIRQRDAWQRQAEIYKRDLDYAEKRREELYKFGMRTSRKNAALRGVITRMKRKPR